MMTNYERILRMVILIDGLLGLILLLWPSLLAGGPAHHRRGREHLGARRRIVPDPALAGLAAGCDLRPS